jgi:type IV secretory pathway TraG/TraD family ATPase VirD4
MRNKNVGAVIAPYFNILFAFMVAFFAFITIGTIFLDINYYKLNIATFLIITVFFLIFKGISADENLPQAIFLYKIAVILVFVTIFNIPYILLKTKVDDVPKPLFFMLNTTGLFIGIFLVNKKNFYSSKDEMDNKKSRKGFFWKNQNKKPGDIEICKDIKTNEPIILPSKDRFLHMLILGPTGSGKTSQVIIPMLNQDLKNKEMGITVIEPKSDLAENVYALAKINGRDCIYFNPTFDDCPKFNPLYGEEDIVIENMATTFKMLNLDSPQFFSDMNEQLIRNSLKVLKRLYGNKATLVHLSRLIQNNGGAGKEIINRFMKITSETAEIAKENSDIAAWFINDYLTEKSKTYEHCSGLRSQVAKIVSNKYLRNVLNPVDGENDIDFAKHLKEGGVLAITTAQGALRQLGGYLGYFIILQFQSAVFNRPGNENTRRSHALYIDEFQTYSNPGFSDMLTQGRSYRVASHLATQNRALMGMGAGRDGKNFVDLVSTNARNIILFPGANAADAEFYAKQFGKIKVTKKSISTSRKKFNPLYGFDKLGNPSESISEREDMEDRISPTDIIYRKFGEITYCIVKNNTLQYPDVGKVSFVSKETKRAMDDIVEEYNESKSKINEKYADPVVGDSQRDADLEDDIEINFEEDFTIEKEIKDGNKQEETEDRTDPILKKQKKEDVKDNQENNSENKEEKQEEKEILFEEEEDNLI